MRRPAVIIILAAAVAGAGFGGGLIVGGRGDRRGPSGDLPSDEMASPTSEVSRRLVSVPDVVG